MSARPPSFRSGARRLLLTAAVLGLPLAAAVVARGAEALDEAPIRYASTPATDRVARLQQRLARGEVRLSRDAEHGLLPALLRELEIPVSSQLLVFSRTSFQRERISPTTPRAIYFGDDVYVGHVQGSAVLEFSAVDPQLGAVFYTLEDRPGSAPRFMRQTYECLSCHSSVLTQNVPGHTFRSVFTQPDGQPLLQAGTRITTDASPLEERWGGWYVTGTVGGQRHQGNLLVRNVAEADSAGLEPGSNVTELRGRVNLRPYLARSSDIVALLVAEHQAHLQNLLTRAGYETRRALHYQEALNRGLGRPPDEPLESTTSRIRAAAEPLVRGLLLSGAVTFTEPVRGTTSFALEFQRRGTRDARGRTLRELDLERRLFRYPCSYVIHSEAFDALPVETRRYVYRRLRAVLSGADTSPEFRHLTAEDRQAVLEILTATKPEFAAAE